MVTLHPSVIEVARHFRVVGMGTPSAVRRKCDLLMHPNAPGERVTVVLGDAIRCSSTLVAALAAGAVGVTVIDKAGEFGTKSREARRTARALGVEMVRGGELHGRPIPGGVLGNSPLEVTPKKLRGRLLHFSSTNFGACFTRAMRAVQEFEQEGGTAEALVATLWNASGVGNYVRKTMPNRVFLGFGGFYDFPSVEDHLLGGTVLAEITDDVTVMDDDARLMWAVARVAPRESGLGPVVEKNWISRALQTFGRGADVEAVVVGLGLHEVVRERAPTVLPRVQFIDAIPVVVDGGSAVRPCLSSSKPQLHKEDSP